MPVSVPKYNEMMWPTLEALKALGGSARNKEIADKVIEMQGFSEEKQDILHNDGPLSEIEYRLQWSQTYLMNGGAIDNSQRGVWTLTDKGRHITANQVAAIPAEYKKQLQKNRRESPAPGAITEIDEVEVELAAEGWKDELLQAVMAMTPAGFERLASRLLREAGFIEMRVTGRSGDGGIDGLGIMRAFALVSFPVYFQCKKWKGSVGSKEVRDFRGAMSGRGTEVC